jgi:polyhydroxybutyrate depolymerase
LDCALKEVQEAGMSTGQGFVVVLLGLGACGHTAAPHSFVRADGSVNPAGAAEAGGASSGTAPSDAAEGDKAESGAESGSPAKTETLTIMDQGKARIVIVHSPAHGQNLLPLIFNLHGSGGNAADQQAFVNMDQAADQHGFIVAYAQGAIALGAGFAWNVPGQPLSGGGPVPPDAPDDIAFFAEAIAFLEGRYPIDPQRVYASGFSGGGRMTSQLGCDLSTLVAAVAPVAGLRFPSPCNSARPVPVVSFHGSADPVNPYGGGGPTYWTYSVPSAAEQWALHDGCGAAPAVAQAAPGVDLTSYTGCAAGAVINLYTIAGAGHEWPGAAQQNNAIDATSVMWSFFAAHPLP